MALRDPAPHSPVGDDAAGRAAATPRAAGMRAWVRLARPKQWLKNLLVLAAPGAAGLLTQAEPLADTLVAFVCFCLAASGSYFVNDALDAEADRQHADKRSRPVAAGLIAPGAAKAAGIALVALSIALSFAATWQLAVVVGSYVVLSLAYSVWLKHEAVVDLAVVASGFVLRAIAGGVAVQVEISPWFLIVAASGSLFMVTGKRHSEMLELGTDAANHRPSLAHYSPAFLGYVRAVASSVAILAYCLWAFEESEPVGEPIWFELSIVPFVLGILRYAFLLEQGRGGAPEDLVLADRTLLVIGLAWAALFAVAVHGA